MYLHVVQDVVVSLSATTCYVCQDRSQLQLYSKTIGSIGLLFCVYDMGSIYLEGLNFNGSFNFMDSQN